MKNKIGFGLNPLKEDIRDIKFGAVYSLPALKELPAEYETGKPINIKNQQQLDFCGAFSGTAVSEDQEAIELDPLYQFAKIKQISGDPEEWGTDLRTIGKSFKEFGSIEKKDAPFGMEKERNFLADHKNYPIDLDDKAKIHKKQSYMFVGGSYDFFDNIRATLWANRDKKKSCVIGVLWASEWTNSNGIIKEKGTPQEGHAIKVFGWKMIEGEPFLKIQNSWGETVGDKGVFYFPRNIINLFSSFGGIVFDDMPAEKAKIINDKMNNILYRTGKKYLGQDMSKTQNELGCVEALSAVFYKAIGQELGENLSTIRLYNRLYSDKRFQRVTEPQLGDIIISPTNGQTIGHTGIISDKISDKNFLIMSNRSSDSLWSEHLTVAEWWYKYKNLPTAFFRYKEENAIINEELNQKKITLLTKLIEVYKQLIEQLKMKNKLGALSSSQNPEKLSLTIKGVILSLLPLINNIAGVEIGSETMTQVFEAVITLSGAVTAVIGYIRSKR